MPKGKSFDKERVIKDMEKMKGKGEQVVLSLIGRNSEEKDRPDNAVIKGNVLWFREGNGSWEPLHGIHLEDTYLAIIERVSKVKGCTVKEGEQVKDWFRDAKGGQEYKGENFHAVTVNLMKVYVTNITKDTNTNMGYGIWQHHVICDCTYKSRKMKKEKEEKQTYRIFSHQEYEDVISKGYYYDEDWEGRNFTETDEGT